MAADKEIMIASNEFILSMRLLRAAYPNFIDEKILKFSGRGRPDHVSSLYVLTENYLYLYNGSNALKFKDSPIFEIPIGCIKSIGYGKAGMTDIVYAYIADGNVIALKNYLDTEQLIPTIKEMNSLIKTRKPNVVDSKRVKAVAMQLTKPFIKKDEYFGDYLSPYTFEEKEGYYDDYMKKREPIVKKVKKNKSFGDEDVLNPQSVLGLKVKDVLVSV